MSENFIKLELKIKAKKLIGNIISAIAAVSLIRDNCRMNFIDQEEPAFDDDGYRPNVGIIITNQECKVFWARRVSGDGWQFPQGGVDDGETVLDAMYRELEEETGFLATDVELVARTENWLRYDLPDRFLNSSRVLDPSLKARFKGQKQMWFLLNLMNKKIEPNFELNDNPEFDDWCWINYWKAADRVVYFKRDVYRQALKELAEKLPNSPLSESI